MPDEDRPVLDTADIQAAVLRARPVHYRGMYVLLRIDDAVQGREMLKRLIPHVAPAADKLGPKDDGWLGLALTFSGLKALGLPRASLDSFPQAFREGMAARATVLHDFGHNAPANWEAPFGSPDVHVALAIYADDDERLQSLLERARQSHHELPKIEVIYRLPFSELPDGRNPFGFKDGLHNPTVEGSDEAEPGSTQIVKAGEFIMGYVDEEGRTATAPEPECLRLNGTFVAFRKFHTQVAAFRSYLDAQADTPEQVEHLAAKMVGRWRSGAPLVLAPEQDDAELGGSRSRNNAFGYKDDLQGFGCPKGAHIRRVNPRDALDDKSVAVNLHHFLRRGTNYGDPLPEGVLEDDGADRGGVFLFIGAHLERQFEFVQSQWLTDGNFIGQGTEQDPITGNAADDGVHSIQARPVRRRLQGIPQFVRVNGGEYCFMPGLRSLQWIASLDSAAN